MVLEQDAHSFTFTDSDLTRKVRKTCDKITENLYVASNEPALACYRIQEHIQKTVPILVDKTMEMQKNEPTLKGLLYDIEYSQSTVKSLASCPEQFSTIQQMLKDSVFYKQQIDYNESIRRRVQERMIQKQESQEAYMAASTSPKGSSPSTSKPSTPTLRNVPKKQGSGAFNRFSTSFDFSSASFPINVASSVSADLKDFKSFISQFASSNLHGQKTSKVVASSSLQALSESPIPPGNVLPEHQQLQPPEEVSEAETEEK